MRPEVIVGWGKAKSLNVQRWRSGDESKLPAITPEVNPAIVLPEHHLGGDAGSGKCLFEAVDIEPCMHRALPLLEDVKRIKARTGNGTTCNTDGWWNDPGPGRPRTRTAGLRASTSGAHAEARWCPYCTVSRQRAWTVRSRLARAMHHFRWILERQRHSYCC
jgi:hypothetical protein